MPIRGSWMPAGEAQAADICNDFCKIAHTLHRFRILDGILRLAILAGVEH
jgi:hypothetical protein